MPKKSSEKILVAKKLWEIANNALKCALAKKGIDYANT